VFDESATHKVYLPPGARIDYQTGKVYYGAAWHQIAQDQLPIVLLVRDHSLISHIKVAQSISEVDWNNVDLRVLSIDNSPVLRLFALPEGELKHIELNRTGSGFAMKNDPLAGKVKWQIKRLSVRIK
jgi:alpha-D-xyloside xylohydrolase